jgi:hypothetical protein
MARPAARDFGTDAVHVAESPSPRTMPVMSLVSPLNAASMCLAVLAALLPLVAAAAPMFEGVWRSATTVAHGHELEGATTLTLQQFGEVVCGEWSEGVGAGKLLGGNLVGRIQGRRMNARIGEEIYWARTDKFPNQRSEPALFVLQGRQLAWYVRDGSGRLVKQQVFDRVEDGETANQMSADFMDRQFARLCPAGTDFISAQ